jgi:hypothetical protein
MGVPIPAPVELLLAWPRTEQLVIRTAATARRNKNAVFMSAVRTMNRGWS